MQGFEHEAVAPERDNDLGIGGVDRTVSRDQPLTRRLRLRPIGGGECNSDGGRRWFGHDCTQAEPGGEVKRRF
jgi:hypothetical protein